MSMRLTFAKLTSDTNGMKLSLEDTGSKHGKCFVHRFEGVRVTQDEGEWSTDQFDLTDRVPDNIAQYITWVSVHANLNNPREEGVYKGEGDTEAEVQGRLLKLRGPKIDGVKALHNKIQAGLIRPTESWAGRQIGRSAPELADEIMVLTNQAGKDQAALDFQDQELTILRGKLETADKMLQTLREICSGKWPLIRKIRILDAITIPEKFQLVIQPTDTQ